MCYIQGGKPEGSSKKYNGCTDNSPPFEDKPIKIPHELYFGGSSSVWCRGGVAFIKPTMAGKGRQTLGRMYLITRDQFTEVVQQENKLEPRDSSIKIDFEKTITDLQSFIGKENEFTRYGRIIYLGEDEGHPKFTFTAKKEIYRNRPCEKYLSIIREGLRETYPSMSDVDTERYVQASLKE
jgi:hypothetical protein